jgi:branched-chain amino acid transport system ATP-binding protein
MLTVRDLDAGYGSLQALWGVSLEVKAGEIVAVIGANGAGKTTLLRSITGLLSSSRGEVVFEEEVISRLPPNRIVGRGIALVPEGRKIFPYMTVRENLEMGAYVPQARANLAARMDEVTGLFPRLRERARQPAGTLSGGEQQMLAIGRALMSRPRVLLLDEPSLGLAPLVVKEIFRIVQAINRQGTTILLVEQNVRQALEVAERAYVLETGRIRLSGAGRELLGSPHVRKAYLGV